MKGTFTIESNVEERDLIENCLHLIAQVELFINMNIHSNVSLSKEINSDTNLAPWKKNVPSEWKLKQDYLQFKNGYEELSNANSIAKFSSIIKRDDVISNLRSSDDEIIELEDIYETTALLTL